MKFFTKKRTCLFLILLIKCVNSSTEEETSQEKANGRASKIIAKTLLEVGSEFIPFLHIAVTIWDGYDELTEKSSNSELHTRTQIALLASKVDQISRDVKYFHDDLTNSVKVLGLNAQLQPKLMNLYNLIAEIEIEFDDLTSILKVDFTQKDIEPPIMNIIDRNGMALKLQKIVHHLTEYRDVNANIIQLIGNPQLKTHQVCSYKASVQQILYNHFRVVHGTLIKGLWMLMFANRKDDRKTLTEKKSGIQIALSNHFLLLNRIISAFQNPMDVAPRDMWMCDPGVAKEGKTYERIGRAFQKYLLNEKNIQPSFISDKEPCPGTCEDIPGLLYQISKKLPFPGTYYTTEKKSRLSLGEKIVANYTTSEEIGHYFMHDDVFKNYCSGGTVKDCKTINELSLTVCPARQNAIERYAYIKDKDNSWTYGSESSCQDKPQEISAPKEKNQKLQCSYCMCTCDYDVPQPELHASAPDLLALIDTDRYIDLKPVVADKGHVVTGVRLSKNSITRSFYLQIKQAKLLAKGHVSGAHWKNITSYYPAELVPISDEVVAEKYENGLDYHKIKYNNTVLYLDNRPYETNGQVLTGVSFEVLNKESKGRTYLGLVPRLSYFNFTTGHINEDGDWQRKNEDIIDRHRVEIDNSDLPTKFNGQNKEISDQSSFVELVNSPLETDVGQNILPFIDIQSVETNPPVPLAGVGLYHRGFKGSGGYLGLKATILNLKTYYLPDTKFLVDTQKEILNALDL